MRLIVLAAVSLLATAAFAGEGPERTFGARDLFGLQAASDPQVRPDGGAVAYVRISNDIMTDRARRGIWLVDIATGEQSPLAASDNTNMITAEISEASRKMP